MSARVGLARKWLRNDQITIMANVQMLYDCGLIVAARVADGSFSEAAHPLKFSLTAASGVSSEQKPCGHEHFAIKRGQRGKARVRLQESTAGSRGTNLPTRQQSKVLEVVV